MHCRVFLRQQEIAGIALILREKFHEKVGVIQLPDTRINFKKQVVGSEIAEDYAAITIANEIAVVTKLKIKKLTRVKIHRSSRVEIVVCGSFEGFIKPCTRYCKKFIFQALEK